jgi:hypothetical protein
VVFATTGEDAALAKLSLVLQIKCLIKDRDMIGIEQIEKLAPADAEKVCPFARRKHTERIEPDKERLATQRFELRGLTSGRPLKQFSVFQVDLGERVSGRHASILLLAMVLLIGAPDKRLKALSQFTLPYIAWE